MIHLIRVVLILLGMVLFYSRSSFGQCIANAGNDTSACVGMTGVIPFQLGGNPTVTGITAPYTYIWEANVPIGSSFLTASIFLNDTTLANPTLTGWYYGYVTLYLTVIDSAGDSCFSSVTVSFSTWTFSLLDKSATINQGESTALFPGITGGISPISTEWTPNYNIDDPTAEFPLVNPDSTVSYVVTMTDSAGCQMTDPDEFEVYVTSVGQEENSKIDRLFVVYPNPAKDSFTIKANIPTTENATIRIYGIKGELIFEKQLPLGSKLLTIDVYDWAKGVYVCSLEVDGRVMESKKMIVE